MHNGRRFAGVPKPSVADAVARNLAMRADAGLPPVVDDPAALRVIVSVLADHVADSGKRAVTAR